MMFKRGLSRDDAWEGIVAGKKRSSPDGHNMYHRITVTLSDGNVRDIRVRRALWDAVKPGDQLVKRPGDKAPTKVD